MEEVQEGVEVLADQEALDLVEVEVSIKVAAVLVLCRIVQE